MKGLRQGDSVSTSSLAVEAIGDAGAEFDLQVMTLAQTFL